MSINFENSPISEVVVSTYFNPPLSNLRSEHIGLFWKKLKSEFPVVNQQLPAGAQPDPTANELFPMPRYWFIGTDDIDLIQVQKNAFIFNWRRRNNEYPRFHGHIKPAFDRYYNLFDEFIRTEVMIPRLSIDLCELTYVNTIEKCDFWAGPQDTNKVISSFISLDPGISNSSLLGFSCNYSYEITTDLQLNLNIRNGFVAHRQNMPVLVFEIKANTRFEQVLKSEVDEWFERAHDAIIECFVSITSRDIQEQFWNRVEDM